MAGWTRFAGADVFFGVKKIDSQQHKKKTRKNGERQKP
jgi:hypothetical protein